MFEIFAGLFDQTLVTLKFTPQETVTSVALTAILNTAIRFTALSGLTYGAIRVVQTAVAHGPF